MLAPVPATAEKGRGSHRVFSVGYMSDGVFKPDAPLTTLWPPPTTTPRSNG